MSLSASEQQVHKLPMPRDAGRFDLHLIKEIHFFDANRVQNVSWEWMLMEVVSDSSVETYFEL